MGAGEQFDEAEAGEVLAGRGGGQAGVVGLLALSPGGGVAEDAALAAPGAEAKWANLAPVSRRSVGMPDLLRAFRKRAYSALLTSRFRTSSAPWRT